MMCFKRALHVFLFLLSAELFCHAQPKIVVTGVLTEEGSGMPVINASVYAFDLLSDAMVEYQEAAMHYHRGNEEYLPACTKAFTLTSEKDGSYQIEVCARGALLFYKPGHAPVIVNVRGEPVHNVQIGTEVIEEAVIHAQQEQECNQ